jgi:hypothetical protein
MKINRIFMLNFPRRPGYWNDIQRWVEALEPVFANTEEVDF